MYVIEVGDRGMFSMIGEVPRSVGLLTIITHTLHLYNYTVVHYVNPNEFLHSSLRDGLVRLKMTKAVNRGVEMLYNSIKTLLLEKGLVPEFILP